MTEEPAGHRAGTALSPLPGAPAGAGSTARARGIPATAVPTSCPRQQAGEGAFPAAGIRAVTQPCSQGVFGSARAGQDPAVSILGVPLPSLPCPGRVWGAPSPPQQEGDFGAVLPTGMQGKAGAQPLSFTSPPAVCVPGCLRCHLCTAPPCGDRAVLPPAAPPDVPRSSGTNPSLLF